MESIIIYEHHTLQSRVSTDWFNIVLVCSISKIRDRMCGVHIHELLALKKHKHKTQNSVLPSVQCSCHHHRALRSIIQIHIPTGTMSTVSSYQIVHIKLGKFVICI